MAQLESGAINHEYAPINGLPEFVQAATRFALGADHPAFAEGRVRHDDVIAVHAHVAQVDGVHAIGGTGSLALVAHFLAAHHSSKIVLVSDPTWGRHATCLMPHAH